MQPHQLTNFEIQIYIYIYIYIYIKNKFNGVYSRNDLLRINECTYVINLDYYKSVGA